MAGETKKTVLVDMDGVIADFEQGFEKAISRKFPDLKLIPLTERKIFYCDVQYAESYPHLADEFPKIAVEPGFFRNLPLMQGAKEGLEVLNERYNLFICSSPMRDYHNCVREKYEWVEEHFGFDLTKKIILTRDKTLVHGSVLIDDKAVIRGCMRPTWKHVVFDQPYNSHTQTEFRLTSWKDITPLVDYIDSLSD